ncbi:MAG: adenylate/guanylate cyclase domain-containing protein [Alphaproteobacteria bacterium]
MERQQRRLVAILAADVVGYSRLMAADEAGTLARFNALRAELIEPKIEQYGGRLVGSAGDSLLVEFASAVDAVQCAVETQERLAERNANLPDDRRMAFRMGVNLGDVIAERGTIHGDGVNVAARLEKLALPGSVAVSRSVHDQVKGKLAYDFADLGEQTVHNIPEPLRAYRVSRRAQEPGAPRPPTTPRAVADRPSIAALPFTNMSGGPEQDYFCDGITEDIITELSRFRELFVIARNSSFAFKGKAVKVDEIARALGVAYVVEGSVRKAGNRVRVTAQLIEAATDSHLWAERYDRELEDIFAIQDEITRTVVTALPARIEADRLRAARRKPTESMDAYDFYLRGKELTARFSAGDLAEEIALFERAVELDPAFARAYTGLSFARLRKSWQTLEPSDLARSIHRTKRDACSASAGGVTDAGMGGA